MMDLITFQTRADELVADGTKDALIELDALIAEATEARRTGLGPTTGQITRAIFASNEIHEQLKRVGEPA